MLHSASAILRQTLLTEDAAVHRRLPGDAGHPCSMNLQLLMYQRVKRTKGIKSLEHFFLFTRQRCCETEKKSVVMSCCRDTREGKTNKKFFKLLST